VEAAGIAFVGPTPANMRALGGKESAKDLARACAVPVLEALLSRELAGLAEADWGPELAARGIHPPFLVKASGGGGGRGMRVVPDLAGLAEAVRRGSSEAETWFGDGSVFVERYLEDPRHIEIQVFGDGGGGGVALGERECSLQRRHQKVLEEAPSAVVGPELRAAMGAAALALVRATGYRGAGTVEFLLDAQGAFHFLEMNTRLQVEHPVTELVYGVDLVQAQLELAAGRWPAALGDPAGTAPPVPDGVALEARILAEDPRAGFLPTPGPLRVYREPSGPGIRVDSGVAQGDRISPEFDSLIAKLIVWAPTRALAVARLAEALEAFVILGCTTNLPFLQALARSPEFLAGDESTGWIQAHLEALNGPLMPAACAAFFQARPFRDALSMAFQGIGAPLPGPAERFAAQASPDLVTGGSQGVSPFRIQRGAGPDRYLLRGPALQDLLRAIPGATGQERGPGLLALRAGSAEPEPALAFTACRLEGSAMGLAVFGETLRLEDPLARLAPARNTPASGQVQSPMGGRILEVHVAEGDRVEPGQLLFVLEAMKMQFEISAPMAGRATAVRAALGQVFQGPETLVVLVP
jgi:acetyl/propionyl-CoA carboxylase alpha subunit